MNRKIAGLVIVGMVLCAGAASVQAAISDGLVGYYMLDESNGTIAADASGMGLDGTLIGEELVWVPGHDGGALGCPGADIATRVEFPAAGMSTTAGTVSLWAMLSDPQPTQTRYFFGHTSQPQFSNRIQLYMDSGTLLDVGLGGAHATSTDMVQLKTKTWYHLVMTWDNGNFAVYVDGSSIKTGTYTGLAGALNTIANIGNDGSSAPYEAFGGTLDEVRIYNRAITAAEVKEVFQMPATPWIRAWSPTPADGDNAVLSPLFQWKALDTIRLHNVYLGTDPNLTAENLVASNAPGNFYFHMGVLEPGARYYWRVDGISADMATIYPGEVWSFIVQAETAYEPTPADGANTAALSPDLMWLPGLVALQHHVYFGDDSNAVAEGIGDTDKGLFNDPNFAPGELNAATTYYWRVDEIGPGDIVTAGAVWSFTTVVPIDDFEAYTDEEGSEIFSTWGDGYASKANGSTVGYLEAPFSELTIVHGGKQSMPLDYNNVNAPFYSEAELTFATAHDWTANEVDTLVLYVHGKAGNRTAPVYVTLKDSTGHSATVVNPDSKIAAEAKWVEWKIPLSDFVGVNAAKVKTLIIGVGDRANPVAGPTGLLYIDDIGLCKPASVE